MIKSKYSVLMSSRCHQIRPVCIKGGVKNRKVKNNSGLLKLVFKYANIMIEQCIVEYEHA